MEKEDITKDGVINDDKTGKKNEQSGAENASSGRSPEDTLQGNDNTGLDGQTGGFKRFETLREGARYHHGPNRVRTTSSAETAFADFDKEDTRPQPAEFYTVQDEDLKKYGKL